MTSQKHLNLFEEIYLNTYNKVLKYIILHCSNIDDVNEIIQETYIQLYKLMSKGRIEDYNNLSPFIIGIAKNKIRKYYGLIYRIKTISLSSEKEDLSIEDTLKSDVDIEKIVINTETLNEVWNYIKNKKAIIGKIFYLYYCLGLSIKEIAKELNINESSVKNYLYRTLNEISKLFERRNKKIIEMFDKKYNQEKNYNEILQKIERKERNMTKILKYFLAPVCLFVIVGLMSINVNNDIVKDTKTSEYLYINVYTNKNDNDYYLTANYLEETSKTTLSKENVRVLLARYNKAMSSVPGIPINFIINKNIFSNEIDSVKISIKNGQILEWNGNIVTDLGKEYALSTSKTLYFDPSNNDIINVIGSKDKRIIFSKEIKINMDEDYNYYAVLNGNNDLDS